MALTIDDLASYPLLKLNEAAEVLRISTPTVRKLIKSGRIPAIKTGRSWLITREAIQNLVNGK